MQKNTLEKKEKKSGVAIYLPVGMVWVCREMAEVCGSRDSDVPALYCKQHLSEQGWLCGWPCNTPLNSLSTSAFALSLTVLRGENIQGEQVGLIFLFCENKTICAVKVSTKQKIKLKSPLFFEQNLSQCSRGLLTIGDRGVRNSAPKPIVFEINQWHLSK